MGNPEPTHLIEWLIDTKDKPWSGKVHATIVRLDEATQAEFSGIRKLPTLGQMIRDARGDQQVIRRATQQALRAWPRQSIGARREYRLRGPRFTDFAGRIGHGAAAG